MSSEQLESERECFEATYRRVNEVAILFRADDGEYGSMFTRDAWALWQGARSQPTAPRVLSEDVIVSLNEVRADADYLFGRVAADGSFAQVAANSVKEKLAKVAAALASIAPVKQEPIGFRHRYSMPDDGWTGWIYTESLPSFHPSEKLGATYQLEKLYTSPQPAQPSVQVSKVTMPVRLPPLAVSEIKDMLAREYGLFDFKARPLWAQMVKILAGISIEEQERLIAAHDGKGE
jgi:hypothetical protein